MLADVEGTMSTWQESPSGPIGKPWFGSGVVLLAIVGADGGFSASMLYYLA
jgi:hypothetical protein